MEELKDWIWFSRIKYLGSIRMKKLINLYKTPTIIKKVKKEELIKIEGIGEKIANEIVSDKYKINLDEYIEYMMKNSIEIITINSKYYPEKLKNIYDMPICIYVKGNKENLNKFALSIIGCRENSEYGKIVAKSITNKLVENNIITISGLAKGIDSIVHKQTLESNGKTIGVLGSGLDNIYPFENINLANKIIEKGGTIISEYPLGTKPDKLNFPARNRIISGMSDGVIVIEAKKKSGTMITVDFALEQGKNVFVVPRKYNIKK